MRGRHDAVLVGVGTVLADDPELTCRIPGYRTAPLVRLVIDSHLRTPLMSKLVRTATQQPVWLLHRDGADRLRKRALEAAGVQLIELPTSSAGVDLAAAARALARAGSRASWPRAAARSPPACCAPGWWTGSPGSTRPASSAVTAFRRPRALA